MFNSTCRTIKVCKLLQIVNFDGWTFLAALVLYIQSDYSNHSNRDSDWLINCSVLYESIEHATTLLFASQKEFVLKI